MATMFRCKLYDWFWSHGYDGLEKRKKRCRKPSCISSYQASLAIPKFLIHLVSTLCACQQTTIPPLSNPHPLLPTFSFIWNDRNDYLKDSQNWEKSWNFNSTIQLVIAIVNFMLIQTSSVWLNLVYVSCMDDIKVRFTPIFNYTSNRELEDWPSGVRCNRE